MFQSGCQFYFHFLLKLIFFFKFSFLLKHKFCPHYRYLPRWHSVLPYKPSGVDTICKTSINLLLYFSWNLLLCCASQSITCTEYHYSTNYTFRLTVNTAYIFSDKSNQIYDKTLSQIILWINQLNFDTNDGHALNSLQRILQTTTSKFFHLDIKDDYGLNSHLGILQTTSSKPYVLLGKNLMIGISQISQML